MRALRGQFVILTRSGAGQTISKENPQITQIQKHPSHKKAQKAQNEVIESAILVQGDPD